MTKLTLLNGISGSGKSTWARSQFGYNVISRDDIRQLLFGKKHGVDETLVTKIEDDMLRRSLEAGYDTIIDDTNLSQKYINRLAKIGYDYDADVEIKEFDVNLSTAMDHVAARVAAGGHNVPTSVIESQYKRFKANKVSLPDKLIIEPYKPNLNLPEAFIFDIDGTLAHNHTGRSFYDVAAVVDDDVDEAVKTVLMSLAMINGIKIIIMSGRDEASKPYTEQWLQDNDIYYDELFMRPLDDQRSDDIIKLELFNEHVRDNYNVLGVVDDRAQVVRLWKKLGIKVFNVSGLDNGEF